MNLGRWIGHLVAGSARQQDQHAGNVAKEDEDKDVMHGSGRTVSLRCGSSLSDSGVQGTALAITPM